LPGLDILIPSLLIILMSLSFHEAAHAWTADRLGDPTARMLGRLTLNPLSHIDWVGTVLLPLMLAFLNQPVFGWAKPVPVNPQNLAHPRRDFAVVALAGPVSNLLLAVVAAVFLPLFSIDLTGGALWYFVRNMVAINVLLAVFNLLPIPPLDGGNVLAGIAPEPIPRLIDAMRPMGFIIVIGLMYLGVLGAILGPLYRIVMSWLT
jgi:Zn-dependent protease